MKILTGWKRRFSTGYIALPVRLRRWAGEDDGEDCSGVREVCGGEASPVFPDDAVGDGEPESGSASFRGVEGVEYPG